MWRQCLMRLVSFFVRRRFPQMRKQLDMFQASLTEFATKYRKEIQTDPQFRAQFQDMCAKINVDPLACTGPPAGAVAAAGGAVLTAWAVSPRSVCALAANKGFWVQLLGFGDFYYELGVQVITVCYKTRPQNGGLIELSKLVELVRRLRGKNAQSISEYGRARRAGQTVTQSPGSRGGASTRSRGGVDAAGTTWCGQSRRSRCWARALPWSS